MFEDLLRCLKLRLPNMFELRNSVNHDRIVCRVLNALLISQNYIPESMCTYLPTMAHAGTITTSIRRFFARPSNVSLLATGLLSPYPCDVRGTFVPMFALTYEVTA